MQRKFNFTDGLLKKIQHGATRLGSKLKLIPTFFSLGSGQLSRVRKSWQGSDASDRVFLYKPRRHMGSRKRQYIVHEPAQSRAQQVRPLVLVLHGCKQDHYAIQHISAFNEVADKYGFVVAYPFITSYRGLRFENCWGWWFDREIHAGAGEVEDLRQIIEEIQLNYQIDPNHIHVAGLSSGAGMSVAMMVAHTDKIASGAVVAGVPYAERAEAVRHVLNKIPRNKPLAKIVDAMQKEMGEQARMVPIQIIHSHDDQTVDIQSAENIRDSWGLCFGIDTQTAVKASTGVHGGTLWQHCLYGGVKGSSAVETLFLHGPGHGWYGGNEGEFSFPDGPNISEKIWAFFAAHPRVD